MYAFALCGSCLIFGRKVEKRTRVAFFEPVTAALAWFFVALLCATALFFCYLFRALLHTFSREAYESNFYKL